MPESPVTPRPPSVRWASGIYDAVVHPLEAMRRVGRPLSVVPVLAHLQRQAANAIAAELAADYARLAATLPDLIGAAELAALHAPDRDHTDVSVLLADVYAVTAWTLIKADAPGAAWIAAQRAIQTAENAGDVLRAPRLRGAWPKFTCAPANTPMRPGQHSSPQPTYTGSMTIPKRSCCADQLSYPQPQHRHDAVMPVRPGPVLTAAATCADLLKTDPIGAGCGLRPRQHRDSPCCGRGRTR